MLVLTRKLDEAIVIGADITVKVVSLEGNKVRLGISAPREVTVHRQEVADAAAEAEKHMRNGETGE